MLLDGSPFAQRPDDYEGETIRLDKPMNIDASRIQANTVGPQNLDASTIRPNTVGHDSSKESLEPVAAMRAVAFLATNIGLASVFVGAGLLWSWPLGLLLAGVLAFLVGVIFTFASLKR